MAEGQLPDNIGLVCLGHRTRMAARAVTRMLNQRLRPLNLQITQFTLLVDIAQGGTGSIASMSDRLDIEASALLRNIALLEGRGLVASEGGRGRNGRRLSLTPAGQALLQAAAPVWAAAQADLRVALGGESDETRRVLAELEVAALSLATEPAAAEVGAAKKKARTVGSAP